MAESDNNAAPLLEVEDLSVCFQSRHGAVAAVEEVSFSLDPGEALAIVGESGSGKSVTALGLTRLLPAPPACRVSGKVLYRGDDVLRAGRARLQSLRGKEITYIFQDPAVSLNPVFTVGHQIAEAIALHFPGEQDVTGRVIESLRRVGIGNPEQRYKDYPHQLSGGMNQRVMIAMALACNPRILVADEPTTALDVTIQAEIMALLNRLKGELGMSIILITHNFGVVKGFADRVMVMFRGKIVETGTTQAVLATPRHPYTKALLACIPRLGGKRRRLTTIDYGEIDRWGADEP